MEACTSAHQYGRALTAAGFTVRLIAPHRVTPYRLLGKAAKNDANDAAAVCEAAARPHLLFVAVKSIEQQALPRLLEPTAAVAQRDQAEG